MWRWIFLSLTVPFVCALTWSKRMSSWISSFWRCIFCHSRLSQLWARIPDNWWRQSPSTEGITRIYLGGFRFVFLTVSLRHRIVHAILLITRSWNDQILRWSQFILFTQCANFAAVCLKNYWLEFRNWIVESISVGFLNPRFCEWDRQSYSSPQNRFDSFKPKI